MKKCRDCEQTKPFEEMQKHAQCADGYNSLCLDCNRIRVKKWRHKNPEKRALQASREGKKDYAHNKHLRHAYGIDLVEYNRMFSEQEGCCAICKTHQSKFKKRLFVDHCHKTENIRALLCQQCNAMLGMAKDDPTILQNAVSYLHKHTGY